MDEYLLEPERITLRAYQNLNIDGLVDLMIPKNEDGYRLIDHSNYARSVPISFDECIAKIEDSSTPEQVESSFDFESEYREFKQSLLRMQELCDEMVWMPAQWTAGARADWYIDIGYENYFLIIGGYPKIARKLMELGDAHGRNHFRIVACAVKEEIYPKAILLGNDLCTQRGPMISPDFLEKYYAPQLKYGLEPLLEVGCKPVWHCDGDCRLILDMLIDCGVQGFQGFQSECGMHLESIIRKKTKDKKPLLIFGPISVTSELPVCSPNEITSKVKQAKLNKQLKYVKTKLILFCLLQTLLIQMFQLKM
ncbi:hypothetical protein ES705_01618 [subsurface metagenome]|nr:hypothetical protein [Clostridia bacterium]